jgi:hypothetical protein
VHPYDPCNPWFHVRLEGVVRVDCKILKKIKLRETAVQKFPYSLCGKDAAAIPIPMRIWSVPDGFFGMAHATLKG